MSTVLQRIAQLAQEEHTTIGAIERVIGASAGVISRAIKGGTDIQSKWLTSLLENFPSYSGTWLLTGRTPSEELADRLSDIIRALNGLCVEDIASYFDVSGIELGNFTNNLIIPKKPLDYRKFFNSWPEFSYEWLLVGTGLMYNEGYSDSTIRQKISDMKSRHDDELSYSRPVKGPENDTQISYKEPSDTAAASKKGPEGSGSRVPLIPYDAIAGYGSFDFQDLPIEEYYTVSDFKGADFLIRVKGDSMYPRYNNGDIVACKVVEGLTFWQWHKIYAICTQTQGVLIKRIEPDEVNPAFIQCVSENPSYKPFYVHQDELVSIALVMGAVVLE